MQDMGPYLRLTDKGVKHINGIIALFYAPAVKDYLVHLESSLSLPASSAQTRRAA